MFKLFNKTSKMDKLQKKYEKLMKEWHALSSINRSESDKKYAEAEAVRKQMEALQKF
ncbi:Lacal_2735 family protein [Xanthomarina gelatinilytica]|uniref:Lacal_2735 family protein n=1 Tax=Xanthomarina gelatinilytica TaxID=1137281 RepID=UPI003AA7BFCE